MPGTAFSSNSAKYYAHSGQYPMGGLLAAVAFGCAAALILGPIYAYIDLYNPIAGWITFLMTGGTGFLLGAWMASLLKWAKVRNVGVGVLATLLVAAFFLAWAWLWWVYAFLRRAKVDADLMTLATHPGALWDLVVEINRVGAWSIKKSTPTGVALWLIWAVEAGALLWIPMSMVKKALREAPFCETCGTWCQTRTLVHLNPPAPGQALALLREVEARNFAALVPLGKASDFSLHTYHVFLQGCSTCDTTQTLCIDEQVTTVGDKGEKTTKTTPIVQRLMITPEETVGIATTVALLNMPPEPAEAPANDEPAGDAAASTGV